MSALPEIFDDLQSLIKEPKKTIEKILSSERNFNSKIYIAFSLFMSTYYVFLPSYLLIFNVLAIFIFFLLFGFTYYFVQEMSIVYHEVRSEDESDKSFYTLAYCFALASVPALFLNLLNNVFSLLLMKNFVVGLFIAALINVPIGIVGIFYCQKVLNVVSQGEYDLQNLIEISSRSFITTLQENFGLRAVQELAEDFKTAS